MVIAFEGSHRSGKGTQIELLKEKLQEQGKRVIVFYEPCGTEEKNRDFLNYLFASGESSPEDQLKAFQQARENFYSHLKEVKKQNSEAVILVDRSVLSLEIQRIKGVDKKKIRKTQEVYLPNYDLIFVLDMEREGVSRGYEEFKKRSKESHSVGGIEEEGQRQEFNPYRESEESYHRELIGFYHQVAKGELFANYQEGIVGINALAEKETVAGDIWNEVGSRLHPENTE